MQQSLAMAADHNAEFEQYRRPTKRDAFLARMEEIVPWSQLCSVIEPHYPKAGNGRPPIGPERMVRMYFVQHWFNLADEACCVPTPLDSVQTLQSKLRAKAKSEAAYRFYSLWDKVCREDVLY